MRSTIMNALQARKRKMMSDEQQDLKLEPIDAPARVDISWTVNSDPVDKVRFIHGGGGSAFILVLRSGKEIVFQPNFWANLLIAMQSISDQALKIIRPEGEEDPKEVAAAIQKALINNTLRIGQHGLAEKPSEGSGR